MKMKYKNKKLIYLFILMGLLIKFLVVGLIVILASG